MITQTEIDDFMTLYINLKRAVRNNPYIRLPKDRKVLLDNATQVLEKMKEIHADPIDFLQFMCKYYSPMRIFPSLRHLLNEKAINKYRYHQSLTNKFVYDDVSFDRDNVFIYESLETVSYKNDFITPLDQDLRLRYAIHLSKNDSQERIYNLKERNDIIYALIKLRYLNKPIPEELLHAKEKIDASNKM